MKEKWTPGSLLWRISKIVIYVSMVFFALTFVAIFVWVLLNSFKTAPGFMQDALGLPKETWESATKLLVDSGRYLMKKIG